MAKLKRDTPPDGPEDERMVRTLKDLPDMKGPPGSLGKSDHGRFCGCPECKAAALASAPEAPAKIMARAALGYPKGATREQIEAAFREKAKTAHPDAGGSDDAMKALLAARDEALR